ncbi:hypothetical protein HDV05_002311 [Chytridiales sp. JEL 0842]|nr:hypothetical protein HDV05_002311 [Chytridiales sp. JEL 0842]
MNDDIQLAYLYDSLPPNQDTDPYLDKLGGTPVWLHNTPPTHLPPPRCETCSSPLFLIAQILATLPETQKVHERVLYLFGCNSRECVKSETGWVVLRGLRRLGKGKGKVEENRKEQQKNVKGGKQVLGKKEGAKKGGKDVGVMSGSFAGLSLGSFGDEGEDTFGDEGGSFGGFEDPAPIIEIGLKTETDKMDELEALLAKRDQKRSSGNTSGKKKAGNSKTNKQNQQNQQPKSNPQPPQQEAKPTPLLTTSPTPPLPSSAPASENPWSTFPNPFPATSLEFAPAPPSSSSPSSSKSTTQYTHELSLLETYRTNQVQNTGTDPLAFLTTPINKPPGGGGGGEPDWAGEQYEKIQLRGFSKSFKRFQKVLEEEPEQLIRYGGFQTGPLFFADDQVSTRILKGVGEVCGPPVCGRCGKRRRFEMQVMPGVLSILPTEEFAKRTQKQKQAEERKKEGVTKLDLSSFLERFCVGMDFGTVLVYTCEADCGFEMDQGVENASGVLYVREWAVAQVEEELV